MTDTGAVIDWLLDPEHSDPSIRWQVMRDVLDAPQSEWAAERYRVETEGWGARLMGSRKVRADMSNIEFMDSDRGRRDRRRPDPLFSWENVRRVLRILENGARLVAMHRNPKWTTPDGLMIDSDAYVAALELAVACEAETAGKPTLDFFRSDARLAAAQGSVSAALLPNRPALGDRKTGGRRGTG
jgi:hypothetical protein